MSSEHRRAFFSGVKNHSQVKLRAVARYLPPWTAKVGSISGVRRVWIIDGFAGAGRYDSGELGSPGIALRHAQAQNGAGRGYKVACFFVEADASNYQRLNALVAGFENVEAVRVRDSFWNQIDNVVSMVGDSPAFVFIDPFGLRDLKFEGLARLSRSLPRLDLMVNLASPAAARLARNHSNLVTGAIGSTSWTPESVTNIFAQNLRDAGRFLRPAVLPVETNQGELKYEVIMAARNPAAYELWNNEIARDDSTLMRTGAPDAVAERIAECVAFLQQQLLARRMFRRDKLILELCVEQCGEFHRSVYLRAFADLLTTGWERDPGPVGSAWSRRL